MKIDLATRNQGKVRELVPILKPLGFELVTQDDLDIPSPEETGTAAYSADPSKEVLLVLS